MAAQRSNSAISNDIAIQIQAMIQEEAQPFFPVPAECCIYRVPHEIRKFNPEAYTPKVVSIGPFHYGHRRLQNMEGQKLIYCSKFLLRSREGSNKSLKDLVSGILLLELRVRGCYSENIQLNKEDFVKMIFVDCAFVIELFSRMHLYKCGIESAMDDVADPIFSKPWLLWAVKLDLLLLENQLPFFVLEALYKLAFDFGFHSAGFVRLSFDFFQDIGPPSIQTSSVAHFTDLLRTRYLLPSDQLSSREHQVLTHLHSATQLNEAGIKFVVNESRYCYLEFSGRILTIPQIRVDESAEILLRNMVALDQCHYPNESYITDHIAFLDFIINKDKDVDFLVRKGIIVNASPHSNKEPEMFKVAEMYNGLLKNVTQGTTSTKYLKICHELNAYYRRPWNRIKASLRRDYCNAPWKTLRRDYCNTPWKTVASFAAILLLALTVVQTVCSVLQVK